MRTIFILAAFALIALAGCGSQVQEQSVTRTTSSTPAFVQAKDGTLYSISCLQSEGASIAANVPGAGKGCAINQLNKSQVRGLHAAYGSQQYYYYVNPAYYYGGTNTSSFCSQYFGYSWNGCFNWLGYNNSYYNSSYYQPTCTSCLNISVNIRYGGGSSYPYNSTPQTSCPSSCSTPQYWNTQPSYNNWNSSNWWYTW